MDKITREDKIVIKALRVEKNWSSCRFLKEFASKAWCRSSLDRLIKKIDAGFLKICITSLLVVCSLHLQKNHWILPMHSNVTSKCKLASL